MSPENGITWLGIASFAVAMLALSVSALTLWLTHLHRGTVKMTRPSQFYFGPDGSKTTGLTGPPKIFVRAMLYATSRRGRVLDSLWVTVFRGDTSQTFNVWVHGDKELVRGGGLFVSETGLVTSHHFLLLEGEAFEFREGEYDVRVFGRIVGDRYPSLLTKQKLTVSADVAAALSRRETGVYFDLSPMSGTYIPMAHQSMTFSEAFRTRTRAE